MTKNRGIYQGSRDREDLSQLQTSAKTQLVDAINEVRGLNNVVNPVVVPTSGDDPSLAAQLNPGFTYLDSSNSTDGDSVALPLALPGTIVTLIQPNSGVELIIFTQYGSGDMISDATAVSFSGVVSDAVPCATLVFICTTQGQWDCNGQIDD